MNNDYYVYVYFDPRTNPQIPIYIGKGKGKRDISHLQKCKNQMLRRKINNIKELGLHVVIKRIYENLTSDDACFLEKKEILKYGRIDIGNGTLCNFTDGGEGTEGRKCTSETRRKMSLNRKNKKQTAAQYAANCAKKHTSDSKEKISRGNKGYRRHTSFQIEQIKKSNATRIFSRVSRQKMSIWQKNRKQNNSHIENNRLSQQRNRYLIINFRKNTLTLDELIEYSQRIIKRLHRFKIDLKRLEKDKKENSIHINDLNVKIQNLKLKNVMNLYLSIEKQINDLSKSSTDQINRNI
jgi:hypothetical protein